MNQLPCPVIQDLLPLYCDLACSRESCELVEQHLAHCPACAETCRAMRENLMPNLSWDQNKREAEPIRSFGEFLQGARSRSRKQGVMIGLGAAVLVSLIAFYLMPLLIVDTGSGMFVLLLLIPFFCFGCSLALGAAFGFQWYYPLAVAALFVPAVFLYFNASASVYIVVFGLAALLGDGIGGLIHWAAHRKHTKK